MLSREQIEGFNDQGFLLVDNIFQAHEIKALREDVQTIFERVHRQRAHPRDTLHHRFDIYNRYPAIKWLLYHPPIFSVFNALMGDSYYTPQENMVAQKGFYSPWHKDTDYYELLGSDFHYHPDFFIVNIAIYLQDNLPDFGGGLEIIPESHKHLKKVKPEEMGKLSDEYLQTYPPYSIPIKAGSIVLFDQRTFHRASVPTVDKELIQPEKMAIFWAVCANNELISQYYEIMKNLYGYNISSSLKFMLEYTTKGKHS